MNGDPADFGAERTIEKAKDKLARALRNAEVPCSPGRKHDKKEFTLKHTQWSLKGPCTYMAVGSTKRALPPGVYRIDTDESGIVFRNQLVEVDDLIYFQESIGDKLIQEVETFWGSTDNFSRFGLSHKRGYLLYGPQGSGKTCIVQQLIQRITKRNGIVFLCDYDMGLTAQALQIFRSVEPNRFILCLFEDIDAIIELRTEAAVLSLLDGESQVNNVLNIATTNYPEKLNPRIINRPRRFDRIVRVDMPSEEVRRKYLEIKLREHGNGLLDIRDEEIDSWVEASNNFSFAALAEMIISVHCLGNSFEETVSILQKMAEAKHTSEDFFSNRAGFGA